MSIHHERLGVPVNATETEIKKAYRRLAAKYHPDVSNEPGAQDMFIAITESYDALLHPDSYPSTASETSGGNYTSPDYHAARRERARAYANMSYEKFKRENQAFQQSWYYTPAKVGTTLLVYAVYFFGFALIVGAIAFLVSFMNAAGLIGGLFLGGIGVRVFMAGRQIANESRQYFPDEEEDD